MTTILAIVLHSDTLLVVTEEEGKESAEANDYRI
jgi:hypothetical protein